MRFCNMTLACLVKNLPANAIEVCEILDGFVDQGKRRKSVYGRVVGIWTGVGCVLV